MARNVDRRGSVIALNDAVQAMGRSAGTAPEFGRFRRAPAKAMLSLGLYYVVGQEGSYSYYRLPRPASGDIGKTVSIRNIGSATTRIYVLPDMRVGDDDQTFYDVEPTGQVVVLIADSTDRYGVLGCSSGTNVQTFSATGTWTKPSWASWVRAEVWGGGGGGGGGRLRGSGNAAWGGSGGGGGALSVREWPVSVLDATVAVTVGAGGTGGTGRDVSTNGGNATPGTTSDFGGIIYAGGGSGGKGGGTTYGTSTNSGGSPQIRVARPSGSRGFIGANNIAAGAEYGGGGGGWSGPTGAECEGGVSIFSGPGGGGGGVVSSGGNRLSGGDGGDHDQREETGGGGAGGGAAVDGADGGESTTLVPGFGGGGGGSQNGTGTGEAGDGGDGGTASGGGGGGGTWDTGSDPSSGKGGDGGGGYVRVTSW